MPFIKVMMCFIEEQKTSSGLNEHMLNEHSVDAPGKKTFDVK